MGLTKARISMADVHGAFSWRPGLLSLSLSWGSDKPVGLTALRVASAGEAATSGPPQPLVELLTSTEHRARTSQNYVRTAVGARLRYVDHQVSTSDGIDRLTVLQRDAASGIEVRSQFSVPTSTASLRVVQVVSNRGDEAVVLTAVTSLSLLIEMNKTDLSQWLLLWGDSEWLAENRWHEEPLGNVIPALNLPFHAQDGRGRFTVTSHGAWSSGEHPPGGALWCPSSGYALAWQIETSAGWHWELSQSGLGVVLSVLGPTDLEHQFAERLAPGASFETVPVAVGVADLGRDAAVAALTDHRRATRLVRTVDHALPVVYNDFMNTLMGDPSTAKLQPLITAAAKAGAEYFCIDAGWYDDGNDWWDSIGEWREAENRFDGGLGRVIEEIRQAGMVPGLWLEPEIVGARTSLASKLPAEAFFTRYGSRVREHDRYHLDLRHPMARAHLDDTVDRLVADYGIRYFKLDYNINPGVGTDLDAAGAGAGLLGHTRAYRDWLTGVHLRHPDVLFENCASGAMRMDYSLLSVAHLQSTSDQQDFLLYPPIAASSPMSALPEQCANWAYPAVHMSDEETAFAMLAGIVGRLYLSGFLDKLRPAQWDLLTEAVDVHKGLRGAIARSHPFWPLGLPRWNDEVIVLGLRDGDSSYLAVWSCGPAQEVRIPGMAAGQLKQLYPASVPDWPVRFDDQGASIAVPAGPAGRLLAFSSAV
jgi:alpha-galactosidase